MRGTLIPIVFAAISMNAWVVSAQAQRKSADPKLAVGIQSGKQTYKTTDNIRLEIDLKNIGKEPLLVCRWLGWAPGHTELRVVDSDGKDVYTKYFPDEVPPPPRDNDFIDLRPGKSFTSEISEIATNFVNTPGSYTVFLEYRSPVSEDWAQQHLHLPKLQLWSSERGAVVSNKINIEVTK